MRITRRGKIFFFLSLGILLAGIAVAVGFGWIILNWREGAKLLLGAIFFGLIIAGLILNTSFLVREIRKNEQHDSFINAVTHELKTPIASIRLYLQTLQRRDLEEAQRRDFYRLMIEDTDRLTNTVEQVLKAGAAGARKAEHVTVDFASVVERCVETARTSHHLQPGALRYESSLNGRGSEVTGDPEDLRTAVSNLLDNAVKFSPVGGEVKVGVSIEGPAAVILVTDHGPGVAPDEMNLNTMYMNRTSANTTQIDDAAKWRIGFAAAQLMRNECGQMRTANRMTATSCVSR
jgi:signal transduction histidine kinase